MARKARKTTRRARRPFPWLWLVAAVVLIAALLWVARNRPRALQPEPAKRSELPATTPSDAKPVPAAAEKGPALSLESDWDRFRLRAESEFLRLVRNNDPAAINRLTSRTLRSALEDAGIGRDWIDERPGAAAAAGAARAPVQWIIQVPTRASLFRINDAVTQAIVALGGRVLRGVERPARVAGTALDLRVGYGDRVTHAIVVEPNPTLADAGTKLSFVVTDLNRDAEESYRSVLESSISLTVALRPGQPGLGRAARDLRGAGREIFLHLPMEPRGYPRVDPGKDAILLDLSRVEIEERISRSLGPLGSPEGIITRMGSAAVNDRDVMRAVLGEVKRRNLLFIDAHGVGPSLVEETGEEMGARTMTLGGTLDGATTTAAVRAKLKQLVAAATQRGSLVVTFKASPLVLSVLASEQERLRQQGIEIVPASKLVL